MSKSMKVKLDRYINSWDEAAVRLLGSESLMSDLLHAQDITDINGNSIIDYLIFDDCIELEMSERVEEASKYFIAPWDTHN